MEAPVPTHDIIRAGCLWFGKTYSRCASNSLRGGGEARHDYNGAKVHSLVIPGCRACAANPE